MEPDLPLRPPESNKAKPEYDSDENAAVNAIPKTWWHAKQ